MLHKGGFVSPGTERIKYILCASVRSRARMSAYNGADGRSRQPIQPKQKAVRKAAKRPRQAGRRRQGRGKCATPATIKAKTSACGGLDCLRLMRRVTDRGCKPQGVTPLFIMGARATPDGSEPPARPGARGRSLSSQRTQTGPQPGQRKGSISVFRGRRKSAPGPPGVRAGPGINQDTSNNRKSWARGAGFR